MTVIAGSGTYGLPGVRLEDVAPPVAPTLRTGVLGKYAKLVGSAAQGAVCDWT